jgi:O-methyltransferase
MGKEELINEVALYSLCSHKRLGILYDIAQTTKDVPGDVVECGVYRGATAKILATVFKDTDKKIHLFDSFQGFSLDEVKEAEGLVSTCKHTSIELVKENLKMFSNIEYHIGYFKDTFKDFDKKLCFVHCDADIENSVYEVIMKMYPLLNKNGALLNDDGNNIAVAQRGIDRAAKDLNIKYMLINNGKYLQPYFRKE